jgi:DNA modification methylase
MKVKYKDTIRHCYGIELTPAYCELSIQRYENLTNRNRIKL